MTSKTSKKFKFLPWFPSANARTFLHFEFLLFRRNENLWCSILLLLARNMGATLDDMGSGADTVVGVVRCCGFVSLLDFETFSSIASGRTSSSSSICRKWGIIFVSIALILLIASQSCERATMRTRWSKIHGRKWESMSMNMCWYVSGMQIYGMLLSDASLNYEPKKKSKPGKEAAAQWRRRRKIVAEHHKTDFHWGKQIKNRFFSSTIPWSALATTTVTSDTWIKWNEFWIRKLLLEWWSNSFHYANQILWEILFCSLFL